MENKHAYLVIAHHLPEQLELLLRLLDDGRNDIYLHLDAKMKRVDIDRLKGAIKKGKLFITPRISVNWGGSSVMSCELLLLKEATENGSYAFYHLISGQDLPIKTQDEIHSFFDANKGKEFVRFNFEEFVHGDRVKYFYPFINIIGRKQTITAKILRKLERNYVAHQKKHKINRIKNFDGQFQKGTNWFSITDDLARAIVADIPQLKKTYRMTYISDEVFLQTFIVNHDEFRSRLYHPQFDNDIQAIQRLIDWDRGYPYVFRSSDYDELCSSDMMFARKFNADVDAGIINMIAKRLGLPDEYLLKQ